MSEAPPRKSHALGWTLSLSAVVLLPLFYLLSFPWIEYYAQGHGAILRSLVWQLYTRPWTWAFIETPLDRPLYNYNLWCRKKMGLRFNVDAYDYDIR